MKLKITTAAERDPGDGAAGGARRLLEVVPRVMRVLREDMRLEAGEGLSVPQLRVLAFLGRTPDASLSSVAEFLGVAGPTASVMVARLVERRLVTRAGDPLERRRVRLALSARGAAVLERSRGHARTLMAERLRGLTRAELETIASALALLDRVIGGARREEAR